MVVIRPLISGPKYLKRLRQSKKGANQEKESKGSATMIKTFEFWRAEYSTDNEEDERNSLAKVKDGGGKNSA